MAFRNIYTCRFEIQQNITNMQPTSQGKNSPSTHCYKYKISFMSHPSQTRPQIMNRENL